MMGIVLIWVVQETKDGLDTVYYGDSGVQKIKSQAYSTGDASTVNADDNPGTFHVSAAALFGDGVLFQEDTWTGWNGQLRQNASFLTDGNELGSSYTNTDTWDNGGTNVTNTHTGYNDPSGNWLGYEWSNNLGEKGFNLNLQ